MKRVEYPAELHADAVKQVTEHGHGIVDETKRLGISEKGLYLWVRLPSMSRGGNCWVDLGSCRNAVAESFLSSLKTE